MWYVYVDCVYPITVFDKKKEVKADFWLFNLHES